MEFIQVCRLCVPTKNMHKNVDFYFADTIKVHNSNDSIAIRKQTEENTKEYIFRLSLHTSSYVCNYILKKISMARNRNETAEFYFVADLIILFYL